MFLIKEETFQWGRGIEKFKEGVGGVDTIKDTIMLMLDIRTLL